jgi:hypothetical protein
MQIFKKIKQAALKSSRLKNYALYAIGEILLVMIGILLAMQVDNYKQNQNDRAKERKAITDLYEEFNLNKQRIIEKQNKRQKVIPAIDSYISQIANNQANYNSFQTFHNLEYATGMTNPQNGVVDALLTSGELSLITNDTLKYLIADWKDQLGNLKENEQILWNVTLDYGNYLQQFVPLHPNQWGNNNVEQLNAAFATLKNNTFYKNKLLSLKGCNAIVIDECNVVVQNLNKVLTHLQKEKAK